MRVIVDTSVWSEYFRRKTESKSGNIKSLKTLIQEGRAVMPGVVKQELLSGIRNRERFQKLLNLLSGFEPLLASESDHILAARYFNDCRSKGVQGSFIDFLICAQATNSKMSILTSDKDFENYRNVIPVRIWED